MGLFQDFLAALGRALADALAPRRRRRPAARKKRAQPTTDYPGDFTGTPTLTYAPREGSTANPGEVCWTWVPFEEDHSSGKDRPVLIIGRDRNWLLGLAMTSQDHDLDREQEARAGRHWVEIGSGDWDGSGRVSEVRVNRIIRVDPNRVRRVAGRLDKARFDKVAAGVRRHQPR